MNCWMQHKILSVEIQQNQHGTIFATTKLTVANDSENCQQNSCSVSKHKSAYNFGIGVSQHTHLKIDCMRKHMQAQYLLSELVNNQEKSLAGCAAFSYLSSSHNHLDLIHSWECNVAVKVGTHQLFAKLQENNFIDIMNDKHHIKWQINGRTNQNKICHVI